MNRNSLFMLAPIVMCTGSALSSPAMAAAPSCPGKSFGEFLTAFADNTAVQRAHVADPLVSGQIDPAAEPEPRMAFTKVAKAKLSFPVMPPRAMRYRDGLGMRNTPKAGGVVEVMLAKPDTGYQIKYLFRPVGTCWQLTSIADESM